MKNNLTWHNVIGDEKEKLYFKQIFAEIIKQKKNGITIFPLQKDIFNALKFTPFNEIKVVILGQDPYHGENQAHGLAFSVLPNVPIPPSLKNIYKELENDIPGFSAPNHGYLESWAKQGILLLNTVLTVQKGNAHSHAQIGWEIFTDRIISAINEHKENVIFLLWGSHAQKKAQFVDHKKHHILTSTHPSPLSAHRGFLGCKHFSKTNNLLKEIENSEINWQIPPII